MVEILDSTLREGELTPGVSFTLKQKIEIANLLDEFGVDFIELGHPKISSDIKKAVRTIAEMGLKSQTVAHARACKEDIDDAIECGVKWVGIFMGINDLSLKYKYHISKEEAMIKIYDMIRYAKDKGLKVRYTPEDTTRTNWDDLIQIIRIAKKAGADRVSIADTVGKSTPFEIYDLVKKIKHNTKIKLNVHCHNDFGLAVANSLAAYKAGAKLIDVCINGLGERVGIASLEEVCTVLSFLFKEKSNKWKLDLLPLICEKVAKFSDIPINYRKPIIGRDSFSHKSGIHISAVLKNPSCYEFIPPEIFGKKRTLIVSKFIGRNGLQVKLKELGLKISEKKLDKVLHTIKGGIKKKYISDVEIKRITKKTMQ